MSDPNFVILYVENTAKSVAFYTRLLSKKPVESSANFAMYALSNGAMLGLWSRHEVKPEAKVQAGGAELGFPVAGPDAVRKTHEDWKALGLDIAQSPVVMDFGMTFVALDPDGHRLRVFAPAGA